MVYITFNNEVFYLPFNKARPRDFIRRGATLAIRPQSFPHTSVLHKSRANYYTSWRCMVGDRTCLTFWLQGKRFSGWAIWLTKYLYIVKFLNVCLLTLGLRMATVKMIKKWVHFKGLYSFGSLEDLEIFAIYHSFL